jgi:solute carrier family 25 protein 39/40
MSVPKKRYYVNGSGITPVQQMASSCTGALLVSLFMTPLDVVKIRLQTQDRLMAKKCFLYSNGIMDHLCLRLNGDPPPIALHTSEEICNCKWYNRPKYFNGTLDAFVKISKVEGISSLWSGLSPTLVLAVPATVIYFTTYEQLKLRFKKLTPRPEKATVAISVASGGLARIWAVALVSPLELVRTKMQSQKMDFTQVRTALKNTIKAEGLGGLWKGLSATLMRDVPFSALYWPCYEFLKPPEYNFGQTFIAGAVAGSIASTVTLPMDVIKTRFQIELGEHGVKRSNFDVAAEIFEAQGIRGFYSGLVPRILKVAPACAIMISSYEYCKRFFHQYNLRHHH